jgi:ATP-dependent helicase/nuclease subunit B
MPMPKIISLGNSQPLVDAVVDALRERLGTTLPEDYSHLHLIVGSTEAGRLIRGELAQRAAKLGRGIIPPQISLPSRLLPDNAALATPTEELLAWTQALATHAEADPEGSALFPTATTLSQFDFRLKWARSLAQLRADLGAEGLSLDHACERLTAAGEDTSRLQAFADLEKAYLEILTRYDKQDRTAFQLAESLQPSPIDTGKSVILIGNWDLAPIWRSILLHWMEAGTPVEIWLPVNEDELNAFDAWGLPIPAAWEAKSFNSLAAADSPLQVQVHLHPEACARSLARQWANLPVGRCAALGWIESADIPTIETHLPFDLKSPRGKSWSHSLIGKTIARWVSFCRSRTVFDWEALLELPAFTRIAATDDTFPSNEKILQAWRSFQEKFLPQVWSPHWKLRAAREEEFHALGTLFAKVEEIQTLQETDPAAALRELLRACFGDKEISPATRGGEAFQQSLLLLNRALTALQDSPLSELLSPGDRLQVLLTQLDQETLPSDNDPGALPLAGWLELPWLRAPLLAIGPLAENSLPFKPPPHPFFPQKWRRLLGLRDEPFYRSRDTALLHILLAWRGRCGGRVLLQVTQTDGNGETRFPSKLLLQGDDHTLPARLRYLLRHCPTQARPVWDQHFLFQLPQPEPQTQFRVTDFSSYLSCPFTYLVRRRLRAEAVGEPAAELDAATFGTTCHRVLERWAKTPAARLTDPQKIFSALEEELDKLFSFSFGEDSSLAISLQFEALRKRLYRFAQLQAEQAADGWEIHTLEKSFSLNLDGPDLRVRGVIDRIDHHPATGRWRLWDYKTSEQAEDPQGKHLANKRSVEGIPLWQFAGDTSGKAIWTNLQLPLYAYAWLDEHKEIDAAKLDVGYINLPKVIEDTSFSLWENRRWHDFASVKACARGIATEINQNIHWEPKVRSESSDLPPLWLRRREAALQIEPWTKKELTA